MRAWVTKPTSQNSIFFVSVFEFCCMSRKEPIWFSSFKPHHLKKKKKKQPWLHWSQQQSTIPHFLSLHSTNSRSPKFLNGCHHLLLEFIIDSLLTDGWVSNLTVLAGETKFLVFWFFWFGCWESVGKKKKIRFLCCFMILLWFYSTGYIYKYLGWLGWTMKCNGNIEFWIVFVNLGTFALSGCWDSVGNR